MTHGGERAEDPTMNARLPDAAQVDSTRVLLVDDYLQKGSGVVVVENDGTVLGADAGFASLVGREESSLPGENVAALSPSLGVATAETDGCLRRVRLELETAENGRATNDCRIAPSSTDEGNVAAVLDPV